MDDKERAEEKGPQRSLEEIARRAKRALDLRFAYRFFFALLYFVSAPLLAYILLRNGIVVAVTAFLTWLLLPHTASLPWVKRVRHDISDGCPSCGSRFVMANKYTPEGVWVYICCTGCDQEVGPLFGGVHNPEVYSQEPGTRTNTAASEEIIEAGLSDDQRAQRSLYMIARRKGLIYFHQCLVNILIIGAYIVAPFFASAWLQSLWAFLLYVPLFFLVRKLLRILGRPPKEKCPRCGGSLAVDSREDEPRSATTATYLQCKGCGLEATTGLRSGGG